MEPRRLHVYIIADCSLGNVQEKYGQLLQEFCCDPNLLDSTWLTVISCYASGKAPAKELVSVTELTDVKPLTLEANSGSNLESAGQLLLQKLVENHRVRSATEKGDFNPSVYLLTNGEPAVVVRKLVRKIREIDVPEVYRVFALCCGQYVNRDVLNEVCDGVAFDDDLGQIARCFQLYDSEPCPDSTLL